MYEFPGMMYFHNPYPGIRRKVMDHEIWPKRCHYRKWMVDPRLCNEYGWFVHRFMLKLWKRVLGFWVLKRYSKWNIKRFRFYWMESFDTFPDVIYDRVVKDDLI